MTPRTVLAVLLLFTGALALTGCTADPATTPAPSPTQDVIVGSEQTPTPTPEPSPTTALPTAAPACDQILPIVWLQDHIDDRLTDGVEFDTFSADALPGPVAKKAFESATVLRACGWGIPNSDGGFSAVLLTITPDAEAELIAAMASSSLYLHRIDHQSPVSSRVLDDGIGWGFAQGFDGGYWAVVQGTMIDPDTSAELVGMALESAASTG